MRYRGIARRAVPPLPPLPLLKGSRVAGIGRRIAAVRETFPLEDSVRDGVSVDHSGLSASLGAVCRRSFRVLIGGSGEKAGIEARLVSGEGE